VRGHAEECQNWDSTISYRVLKGKIENLQTLIEEGFSISFGKNSQCYFIDIKHPNQEEEFTGETLLDALNELRDWFSECEAMQ